MLEPDFLVAYSLNPKRAKSAFHAGLCRAVSIKTCVISGSTTFARGAAGPADALRLTFMAKRSVLNALFTVQNS
jgi:hypothetical protein